MGGRLSLRDVVRMLYEGPFASIDRSLCNPFDSCELDKGRLKWVWVSVRRLASAGLSVIEGIIVNRVSFEVFRAAVMRVEGLDDRTVRFYNGPLILRDVPLSLGDGLEGSRRRCRCGDEVNGEGEWLMKHLLKRHVGNSRPSPLEVEAFVQTILLRRGERAPRP